MTTDKMNALCILRILEEYSDEDHIMTARDIQEKLKAVYDICPDRRTIYGAVSALADLGYEISTFEDNGKGCYLMVRDLDKADIRLLTDAAASFEYISQKQTKELVEKLKNMLSVHERKAWIGSSIIRTDKKSTNSQVFLNIELLEQAISERKKVSFTYMDYDYSKQLVPRRAEPYIANPYAMMVESEHYYLVMILEGKDRPSFYRIDMMRDIRILDEYITVSKKDAELDSISKVVYAHAGEPEQIRLRCDKKALRYCLERFGLDIMIIPS
ncbi:MAG: WYL domain-containing protein, partial [Firmicutes bacterium]|nr:WYL domain-containing protein [Bacillota bacterium]